MTKVTTVTTVTTMTPRLDPPADVVAQDPWRALAALTPARIGLGRAGAHLTTRTQLELAAAHAAARDAVHAPWDIAGFGHALREAGLPVVAVGSRVHDRRQYLERPDLGRLLLPGSEASLAAHRLVALPCDIALIVSDGLSALAVERHGVALVTRLAAALAPRALAPIVLVPNGRVAISDPIGHTLGARLALIVIGERPGLSAADSLGVYLTFDPRPGRTDADRNCISNVRPPDGMDYAAAVDLARWLVDESLARAVSGVALKDARALRTDDPAALGARG